MPIYICTEPGLIIGRPCWYVYFYFTCLENHYYLAKESTAFSCLALPYLVLNARYEIPVNVSNVIIIITLI